MPATANEVVLAASGLGKTYVQPVLGDAAQPGVADQLLVPRLQRLRPVRGQLHDVGNVLLLRRIHRRRSPGMQAGDDRRGRRQVGVHRDR